MLLKIGHVSVVSDSPSARNVLTFAWRRLNRTDERVRTSGPCAVFYSGALSQVSSFLLSGRPLADDESPLTILIVVSDFCFWTHRREHLAGAYRSRMFDSALLSFCEQQPPRYKGEDQGD